MKRLSKVFSIIFIFSIFSYSQVKQDTVMHYWATPSHTQWDTAQATWDEMDVLTEGMPKTQGMQDIFWYWGNPQAPMTTLYNNLQGLPTVSRVKLFGSDYYYKFNNNGTPDGDKECLYVITRDYSQNDFGLPVELMFFTANFNPSKNEVFLAWSTASEINSWKYEVQRSTFDPHGCSIDSNMLVATIPAAGNSSIRNNYYVKDNNFTSGISDGYKLIYTLLQYDINGEIHNKGNAFVIFNNSNLPDNFSIEKIYPNPFNPDGTMGTFYFPKNGNLKVIYTDNIGRTKEALNMTVNSGKFDIPIKLQQNSATGVYYFKVFYKPFYGKAETRVFRGLILK